MAKFLQTTLDEMAASGQGKHSETAKGLVDFMKKVCYISSLPSGSIPLRSCFRTTPPVCRRCVRKKLEVLVVQTYILATQTKEAKVLCACVLSSAKFQLSGWVVLAWCSIYRIEAEFFVFLQVKSSGEDDLSEIIKFSKFFEDSLTLDSLDRKQLNALCKLMEMTSMGTNNMMRNQLKMRLRKLNADDKVTVSLAGTK